MLYQIVYVSSAVVPFDDGSLRVLLEKSRANNELLGITGLLLYRDGNFIQAIEGERATVLTLYQKVAGDVRHRGVIDLLKREITGREFPDWSMGFRNMSDPELLKTPGYSEFLNVDFASFAPLGAMAGARVQKLLGVFRASVR